MLLYSIILSSKPIKTPLPCLMISAIVWLAAATGNAQITYLSDSRSFSSSGDLSPDGNPNMTYYSHSGGWSYSASPSAPYADFSGGVGGSASLVEDYTRDLEQWANSWNIYGGGGQYSSLNAQGLHYQSSVGIQGNEVRGDGLSEFPATFSAWSSLAVSFSVSSPVTYEATVNGNDDDWTTFGFGSLSSAKQGTLFGFNGEVGGPMGEGLFYTGLLLPGDVYTLSITEEAGWDRDPEDLASSYLDVTFEVPEPSVTGLAGIAGISFLLLRFRSQSNRSQTTPE